MSSFGEKLRKWRESKGLSVNKVGELSGIGRPNLINIEKGRRPAADEVLKKLASVKELELEFETLRLWKVADSFPEFSPMIQSIVTSISEIDMNSKTLMKWVTATDLEHWSDLMNFHTLLPELISRLILGSPLRLESINFPTGDSITRGGWDGIMLAKDETLFIPAGYSCWELSCRKDVGKKANEDYKKRTSSIQHINPSETTYVYVTSRRWNNKNNWIHEKKDTHHWKDVRAFDADDLELWLALCPAVGKWLAMKMGKITSDVLSFEEFWEKWATLKGLKISPEMVILNREKQVEQLKNWLDASPNLIQIKAETKDEALAFLVSYIFTLSSPMREYWLYRSLIINTEEDLSSALGAQTPLIIALNNMNQGTLDYLRGKGHYIFVPLSKESNIEDGTYTLSRVSTYGLEEELKKSGLNEQEAKRLTRSSGRSITVLRRLQGTQTDKPNWAEPDNFSVMLPILLLGRWDEGSEGDIKLVESLSSVKYEQYITEATKWLHSSDPPILKIGKVYTLTSHLDAWLHLASFITSHQFERFQGICLTVFKEIHPKFELEADKRYAASMYGKTPIYSEVVREGLTTTLIMLSLYTLSEPNLEQAKPIISNIIDKVLLPESWQQWASLTDIMTELAEASPDSFLSSLERLFSKKPEIFSTLIEEGRQGGIFANNYHSSIFWALEALAWSREYLGRVTLILGACAELELKTKFESKALECLRKIYLPWLPGTYVSLQGKLEALRTLIEFYPHAGWKTLVNLLPKVSDSSSPTYRFKWRSFGDDEPTVLMPEYYEFISSIMESIVDNIEILDISKKWEDVISQLDHFYVKYRDQLTAKLESDFQAGLLGESAISLWESLRTLINHHSNFPEAHWAMSRPEIEKLKITLAKIEPQSVTQKYAWLFSNRGIYDFEESKSLSWDEREKKQAEHRKLIAEELASSLSNSELFSFINESERPDLIGYALAQVFKLDARVHEMLLNIDLNPKTERFLVALVNESFIIGDWHWADEVLSTAKKWPTEVTALFLLALPPTSDTWDRLSRFDIEIQNAYWLRFEPHLHHSSEADIEFVLMKLLDKERIDAAFYCVAHLPEDKKISGKIVYRILKDLLVNAVDKFVRSGLDQYDLERLFNRLDRSDEITEDEIAWLEFRYCSILRDTKRKPRVLYKQIAENPDLYSKLIEYAFLPRNRDRSKDESILKEDKQAQYLAEIAWRLLDSCNIIPGSNGTDAIDEKSLLSWIQEVRKQCESTDRIEVADIKIGHFLARAPRVPNSLQPSEPICNILQKLQNDDVDRGFLIETLNSRGVTTRGLEDEGYQEKELASQYESIAHSVSLRWPRVSKIMKKLAEEYLQEAKRHQMDLDLRQQRY